MDRRALLNRLRLPLLFVIAASGLIPMAGLVRFGPDRSTAQMLPDGDPAMDSYRAFADRFGSDRVAALVLVRAGGFFEPELLRHLSAMCDELEEIPWVRDVESITHTTSVASVGGVMEARPLFTDPPFDEHLVDEGRRELLANPAMVGNLLSANGGAVAVMVFLEERTVARDVLRRLPREIAATPVAYGEAGERLQDTLNETNLALARGEITGDPDTRRLEAVRQMAGSGVPGGTTLAALIARLEEEAAGAIEGYDEEAVERLHAILEAHGTHLTRNRYLLGAPVLRVGLRDRVAVDLQQAIVGAVLLATLLMWIGLRDPFRLPLPMAGTVVGVLWTLALLSPLELPLDQVTVAALMPVVALGLSSATLYSTEPRPDGAVITGTVGGGLFLALLGITMLVQDVEAVRRFGIIVAVGSAATSVACALVVPLSLAVTPRPLPPPARRVRNRWLVLVAVFLGLASVCGMARLRLGVDYVDSLMPRDPLAEAYRTAEDHLAGMEAFRLHVTAPEVDRLKDPEVLEALRALQERIGTFDGVDETLSYVDFIDAIYGALDPQRPSALPQTRTLVGQLLLLFGSPQTLAPYVNADFDAAAVTVRTHVGGGRRLRALLDDVEKAADEILPADLACAPQGELLLVSRGADETARALQLGATRGLMLALAVLMITVRRIRPVLRLALPMSLVVVVSLGATSLGTDHLGPITVAVPWIGLATGVPLALGRARAGRPGSRDWIVPALVAACFVPLVASTLRFDAAVGIGVALGGLVAALFLWADAGVEED